MAKKLFKKKINGMICPQCEDEIYKAIIHKRGVYSADISYRKSEAEIYFETDVITEEEIAGLLGDIGYPVGEGNNSLKSDVCALLMVMLLSVVIPRLSSLVRIPSIGTDSELGIVFVVGLFSGAHCIAMCGGIMLTQKNRLAYNAARLISYMLLGFVFGAVGKVISFDIQFKSMVFTMCGFMVVIIGLRMLGVPIFRRLSPELKGRCVRYGSSIWIGFLNGIMPCAILSSMWINASLSGSAINGALMMLSFGLGTCVLMLAFAYCGAIIPKRYKKYILMANTVLIVSLGLIQVIKGIKMVL